MRKLKTHWETEKAKTPFGLAQELKNRKTPFRFSAGTDKSESPFGLDGKLKKPKHPFGELKTRLREFKKPVSGQGPTRLKKLKNRKLRLAITVILNKPETPVCI